MMVGGDDDEDIERIGRDEAANEASVLDSYVPESEDHGEPEAPPPEPPTGDEMPFPGGKARRPRKKKGHAARIP